MRVLDNDPAASLASGSDIRLFADLFNAREKSRRVFSEVHYYKPADPDLTVGMGHFIRDNLADLFVRLRGDQNTWSAALALWSKALSPTQWSAMVEETGTDGADATALENALERVLCADGAGSACVEKRLVPWADRVGQGFNSNEHWFTAGWRAICQAEPVARHQLEQWRTAVLDKGVKEAGKRALTTRGGIACVISAASSGLGSTMFAPGAKTAEASSHGVHATWSLAEVPPAAKPTAAIDADLLLADWRSVVAWQFYTVKKGRVRERMAKIWSAFFEASWGPAPQTLAEAVKVPRHRGTAMDRRPFDFSVQIIKA